MHRRRVRQVVRRHIHGLDGGDRPGVGIGDALFQPRKLGGHGGLIPEPRRHLSHQPRHFHARLNETGKCYRSAEELLCARRRGNIRPSSARPPPRENGCRAVRSSGRKASPCPSERRLLSFRCRALRLRGSARRCRRRCSRPSDARSCCGSSRSGAPSCRRPRRQTIHLCRPAPAAPAHRSP